jgi:cell division protease FtsH
MSERLGPRTFGKREEMVFLGREITEQRNYSEEVARAIDEEVRAIIEKATNTATQILTEYRSILDKVAAHLIKEETIDGAAFEALFGDIKRPQPASALVLEPVPVAG